MRDVYRKHPSGLVFVVNHIKYNYLLVSLVYIKYLTSPVNLHPQIRVTLLRVTQRLPMGVSSNPYRLRVALGLLRLLVYFVFSFS